MRYYDSTIAEFLQEGAIIEVPVKEEIVPFLFFFSRKVIIKEPYKIKHIYDGFHAYVTIKLIHLKTGKEKDIKLGRNRRIKFYVEEEF